MKRNSWMRFGCLLLAGKLVLGCGAMSGNQAEPPVVSVSNPPVEMRPPPPPPRFDEALPPPPPVPRDAPIVGATPEPQPKGGSAGMPDKAGAALPRFPWPAPTPSASATIPLFATMAKWRARSYFPARPEGAFVVLDAADEKAFFTHGPRLTHVDYALRYLLAQGGYVEASYYAVPGGFAMVTRMERIEADGVPRKQGRWDLGAAPQPPFTLGSYLRALFAAPAGRYRVIVFAVTPSQAGTVATEVTDKTAQAWLDEGAAGLPSLLGDRPFTKDFNCRVLIYEFDKAGAHTPAIVRHPGLPAPVHLKTASLTGLLP